MSTVFLDPVRALGAVRHFYVVIAPILEYFSEDRCSVLLRLVGTFLAMLLCRYDYSVWSKQCNVLDYLKSTCARPTFSQAALSKAPPRPSSIPWGALCPRHPLFKMLGHKGKRVVRAEMDA